jgi:hypothetical protein
MAWPIDVVSVATEHARATTVTQYYAHSLLRATTRTRYYAILRARATTRTRCYTRNITAMRSLASTRTHNCSHSLVATTPYLYCSHSLSSHCPRHYAHTVLRARGTTRTRYYAHAILRALAILRTIATTRTRYTTHFRYYALKLLRALANSRSRYYVRSVLSTRLSHLQVPSSAPKNVLKVNNFFISPCRSRLEGWLILLLPLK